MVDKKTKRVYTEIIAALVISMAALGVGVNVNDEGYIPYSCDKDTIPNMMCYKLSRVNADEIQRNCYYDRDNSRKYKVCSDGWQRIEVTDGQAECTSLRVIAYDNGDKWFCDGIGLDANCVKDGTLEMPFN